tara:strand:+ start:1293 stop:1496 length:204 start_codon:yes stop_codon:yes gene_type:complete
MRAFKVVVEAIITTNSRDLKQSKTIADVTTWSVDEVIEYLNVNEESCDIQSCVELSAKEPDDTWEMT